MMRWLLARLGLALMALLGPMPVVWAACNLNGVQSVTGNVVVLPSFTPPGTTTATMTLTVTFTKPSGSTGNGSCTPQIAFQGTPTTPRMTHSGGSTLNYSLPHYYTTTPSTFLTASLSQPNSPTITITFTGVTVSVPSGQTGKPVGTYTDTATTLRAFENGTLIGSAPLTISTTVIGSCSIGGSSSGGTQTLDFSNGTTISTATKTATFSNVSCTGPATISLSSSNGASKTGGAGGTTHQNFFDYVATTTINGGTATLNTSTNPAVAGVETETGTITATSTTNAPFSVSVTPISPAKPLISGSYADVLTVNLTPQ